MSDVTFRNNSGTNLTLILPDSRQDTFATGNIRTYLDNGKYQIKSGADPVFSLTFNQGSISTDLTGIAIGGSYTVNNQSGNPVNVVSPSGQDGLTNGSVKVYNTAGTYTIKNLTGTDIYVFKFDKGTATTTLNAIA
ncbi:hypothetical protein F5148DRAFT_1148571 [Russula earlei]|uniref:Uncharacterized protein n=1 Tax=Russula earlei TaxID=71964 RepID=A0ACC0UCF7_9AGAM|nr:hypothetical protein F5148DRAFT_1148571 [Russula earlei]